MYRVAFRRILWTARATEEERKMHPEMMTCNYWSNKAIAAREIKAASKVEKSVKKKGLTASTQLENTSLADDNKVA